jgi:hypothetical protein
MHLARMKKRMKAGPFIACTVAATMAAECIWRERKKKESVCVYCVYSSRSGDDFGDLQAFDKREKKIVHSF